MRQFDFNPLLLGTLEVIDDIWIIATVGFGAIDFIGKLVSRKKP
jgi:hypothetical protein